MHKNRQMHNIDIILTRQSVNVTFIFLLKISSLDKAMTIAINLYGSL